MFGATPIKIVEKITIEGFLGSIFFHFQPLSSRDFNYRFFFFFFVLLFFPLVFSSCLFFFFFSFFIDNEFLTDFLQSFRAFMEPIDLLHLFMLRLQWTQESDSPDSETQKPQDRTQIQKRYLLLPTTISFRFCHRSCNRPRFFFLRTLFALKFWMEQHWSDFQNVEIASKIRFHFERYISGMRSAENTALFEFLQETFGIKGVQGFPILFCFGGLGDPSSKSLLI